MIILYVILGLIALFLIYVASRPAEFTLERSRTINAPASKIYPLIGDFRNWEKWSPWLEMEPDAKLTYGNTTSGVGGTYRWDGKKTGSGSATCVEETPPTMFRISLAFEKPMKAVNDVVYCLSENANGTTVKWSMSGSNNFMGKLFAVIFSLEKMVGPQFDRGLELLDKAVQES
ncbi:MAG TPA: SRPBCC family protein [Fimbriimonas sp.]|nr:SRPBCC family protein [Fimbriimonas sp.]